MTKMKRRNFIKNSGLALGSSMLINGLPVRALGRKSLFNTFNFDGDFDHRILVLIQLHGGNDGINTLIPISQYADYLAARAGIAISDTGSRSYINLDTTLPSAEQLGIHPDMTAFKSLYDEGKVNIVHSVGYENHNLSHFRSRDIWWMGGDYDEYLNSGWMGRYLDYIYPNYPDAYPNQTMPDPLGLEIGTIVSLGFHRENGIPVGLANADPEDFSNLISGLGGPALDVFPDNIYGEKMEYISELFSSASDYSTQLEARFNAGTNHVLYPQDDIMEYPYAVANNFKKNKLGWQLQTVARLINGGCQTRIYLVKHHGFDTHDFQVDSGEVSYGRHAALLYHLCNAVKAFQDDLAISQKDENVVTTTFSEFGRRVAANGSLGTDHGTAAPMLVFGKGVNPGITGAPPNLTNLDNKGNLLMQHDYRQVFTTLLTDWMGAEADTINAINFTDYLGQQLDIIHPDYVADSSLPATISKFHGWNEGRHNILEWVLYQELNVERYDIERSNEKGRFQVIGRVKSTGNGYEEKTYTFTDKKPFVGDNFYRLRIVDYDGRITLSQVINLKFSLEFNVHIYPNPFTEVLKIQIDQTSDHQYLQAILFNSMGQQIYFNTISVENGRNQVQLELDDLSSGYYFLRIQSSERVIHSSKVLKM